MTAVIALSGCRGQPPERSAVGMGVVPVASEFSRGGGGGVGRDWVGGFNDPMLSELVEEALAFNPDLRRAESAWREARARVRVANSFLRPGVDGVASYQRGKNVLEFDETVSISQVALSASWEVDVWGRLRADTRAAARSAEAVGLDYAYARQSLAATVAGAWFTAIEAQLQLDIARNLLDLQSLTNKIASAKYAVGAGEALDSTISEANVLLARDAVERSRLALEEARRSLEVLLGRYPDAELRLAAELPALPAAPPVGVPSELLERRPDVVAADRRVAAAFDRLDSAKAARLPRVTLSGSVGTFLDPTEALWSIGANLLAPLYTGGRLEAQVDIADAQRQQALASFVSVGIRAFAEVERALSNGHFLAAREEHLNVADQRLAKAGDIAEQRYEAGVIGILDLTQVRQQSFSVRSTLLSVRSLQLQQRVNLHLALGGSFDADGVDAVPLPTDRDIQANTTSPGAETPEARP